ncbi:Pancreatic lipase-related protein 2 [Halotydeus destructor]|nr:Pancreatic lipase-related protein 2 [Halotydeus destructor]
MSSLIFQFVLVIGVKTILCDRQLCADYVSDYEDQGFMCDTNHNCLVPMIDNLVDACLVGMFIENRDPDSISVRNETPDIDPVTKLMPKATVQPKNYTSYHPMYGYFSGYEEPVYHLGRLPMDPNELQTSFVVLDGAMNKYGGVNALTPETITQVTRDILYEKIYALAHDFNQDFIKSPYLLKLVQLLLVHETPPGVAQTSVAVVVVNWKEGAKAGLKGTFYRQAAVNTMMVGRQTGVLAYTLARSGRVSEANIHLIGYGLGAQLMHFAARWYTRLHKVFGEQDGLIHRVGRLTALDPAAAHFEGFRPLFGEWPHVSRLDALKVDMIVTSGGNEMGLKDDPLTGNYGMSQNVGLRTFYPNGGTGQPFCLNDYQPTDPLNDGDSYKLVSFCNHQKALVYFIYSLLPDVNRKLLLSTPQNSYMDYIRYRIVRFLPTISQLWG